MIGAQIGEESMIPLRPTDETVVRLDAVRVSFCNANREWLDRFTLDSPIYVLPEVVLLRLSRSKPRRQPVFSADHVEFENRLSKFCNDSGAIGLWSNWPIVSPFFKENRLLPLTKEMLSAFPYLANSDYEKLQKDGIPEFERPKGVCGYLMTDPTFLEELSNLRTCWMEIPIPARPSFPLLRLARPAGVAATMVAGESLLEFAEHLKSFLDKWGLIQLVTWDLPEPQGPLFLNPLKGDCSIIPVNGIHIYLPPHFPVQGADSLWSQIEHCQRLFAVHSGLPVELAGLPHWLAQMRMFKIQHLERAICSRFPHQKIPRGRTGEVIEAISDDTGLSVDKVTRYRKDIELCLRGRRQDAEFMQPARPKKTKKKGKE